jgi:hypothetical protein|tara:strand:- start:619 stop:1566 length:948 start_codon:yes stop_codon:yes gene_type:complete
MKLKTMNSPILFIIFNRKEITEQSFKTIREAKPPRLYIAADGPRDWVSGEKELCADTRNIINKIDWDCEVNTLFQEKNLGCQKAVITAINWFFENEEEGVILEDDIIPKPEFFEFVDLMLNKYRDNSNIKAVLGFNQFGQGINNNSYFYSRGFYAWGWATWKSRWKDYKEDVITNEIINDKSLLEIYDKSILKGINFNLKLVNSGLLDTWDYQMIHMIVIQKGFTIVPYANLTSNIGADGAHSINNTNIFHKYGDLSINDLKYPQKIEDNLEMNIKLWNDYKKASFIVNVKNFLFKIGVYKQIKKYYKKIQNFKN